MSDFIQIGNAALYHGDCLTIIPTLNLPTSSCVISDPPYGIKNNCDYTRFSGGLSPSRNHHGFRTGIEWTGITGDDVAFDPTPWLAFKKVALFGHQYFSSRLPVGTVLVWLKRRPSQLGKFLSDAELIWMRGGKGCYVMHHVWNGFDRASERGKKTLHPSQKPVAVLKWIIGRLKLPPDSLIVDPYMGSGSTALAALECGHRFIGVEIDRTYFDIACERVDGMTKLPPTV